MEEFRENERRGKNKIYNSERKIRNDAQNEYYEYRRYSKPKPKLSKEMHGVKIAGTEGNSKRRLSKAK